MHAIVLGSFSFVLIYLFTAVYVCTITIISLLLASTIMTSSCLVVAFSVFPDLSPSAKQQITHIRAPCVSAHTRPLFPVFAVASFFLLGRSFSTSTSGHTGRCSCYSPCAHLAVPCSPGPASVFPAVPWWSLSLSLCPLAASNRSALLLSPSSDLAYYRISLHPIITHLSFPSLSSCFLLSISVSYLLGKPFFFPISGAFTAEFILLHCCLSSRCSSSCLAISLYEYVTWSGSVCEHCSGYIHFKKITLVSSL